MKGKLLSQPGIGFSAVVLFIAASLLVACTGPGENRPGSVSVDPGSETVSVSGTGTGTGIGPGEVKPKPLEAQQLNVTLAEWSVVVDSTTVQSGPIYFFADNKGPNDSHEMVIIRTNLAPGDLPEVDGKVPEDQIDLIGEIEPFAPGSQAADTFDLEPGNYVLICNIVESMEDGKLESHYLLGMRAALVVE